MESALSQATIDESVEREASTVLAGMGLTIADAVRLLLVRIATDHRLPFEVDRPNAATVAAMSSADRGEGDRFPDAKALFQELGI